MPREERIWYSSAEKIPRLRCVKRRATIYTSSHTVNRTIRARLQGAVAPCASCTGEGSRMWLQLQPHTHGRPSPWGEDDAWWRQREQQSPYQGAVDYRGERPESGTSRSRA